MIDPNLSLAVFSGLTVIYVGDCARRLWLRKPTKYASLFVEGLLASIIVFGMLIALQAGAAKVFVIGAFIAATILRLIARQRFAES